MGGWAPSLQVACSTNLQPEGFLVVWTGEQEMHQWWRQEVGFLGSDVRS